MPSKKIGAAPGPSAGFSAAIANGQQSSAALDMGAFTICGFFLPAVFTGTTVTFQAAPTLAGTYETVSDGAGGAYTVTCAAGQYVPVDPTKFLGVRFLKLRSGTAEGGARTITIAARTFQ